MESLLKSELPYLAKDLQFKVEPISGADCYYTDGLAVGSCLKLVIHNTSVYFFPTGLYVPSGHLSQEDKSILDGWLETVRSKKLNSGRPLLNTATLQATAK